MKKYDIRYVGNKGTVDLNTAPYIIKNIETLFRKRCDDTCRRSD